MRKVLIPIIILFMLILNLTSCKKHETIELTKRNSFKSERISQHINMEGFNK